ncbi:MAG: hypothetical protein Q8K04_09230 [Lutibacter sp.]|nr:hypothetical protein [Lutibacter sp.]MDP3944726.1 hypothetical protein [Lutibacter sp.]
MKTLCFILSLYVFFLSVVPCCSDENCDDEVIIENADNHSQEHNEEKDCNACSPFLNCGTCIGFVFSNLQLNIAEIPAVEAQFTPIYKPQFSDDFFDKIWQPPKMS